MPLSYIPPPSPHTHTQGFIATLKDSYGFIESEEHDCELFFPFR